MKARKLMALLLAAILIFSVCACGSSGTSAASSAPAESAAVSESEASPAEVSEPEAAAEPETAEESVPEEVSAEEASEEPEAEPEEPAVVIEYPLFDDTQTYTIWMGTAPDLNDIVKEMDQYVIFRELEKVTNVAWDATMVSFMAESEQFQLMLAGGDYTDVCCKATENYSGTVDQAIDEEFLIDISPYIADNMPNLTGWFKKFPELESQLRSNEGALGAFPKIYKEYSDISAGGMIRADWLADLGLDEPKSFDDLYNVLVAFRDEKGASAPLVIADSTGVQNELISGYNISAGFYQVDGELRFGAVQPEFKEYLTMIHDWYMEGLVDDLFLSNPYGSLMDWSPVLNSTCGVWYGTAAQAIPNLLSSAVDPGMKITGITTVTKDGSVAHVGESGSVFDSNLWSITTVCEDPDVICRYIDYVYSEDGILLANYGVEGETFEYDASGTPRLTDLVLNNPEYSYGACMNMYVCDRMTPVPFVIDEDRVRADYVEDQINAINVWNFANDGLYNMPKAGVNLTVEESQEYNTLYSDIETYMDENVVKFVVGDKSLDEFDSYVDTLMQMGVDRCTEIEQAAYDRYLEG